MKNIQTYLLLMGVMVAWGFNVPIIKILVGYFPPVTITSMRIFTAGITVFIIMAAMKKIRKPSFGEWKFIIFGSLFSIVGHHFFLSMGLTKTSATNGALILGTGPLLTAILSSVLLRNRPTWVQIMGFLFGSAGVSFIVLSGEKGLSGLSIGDLNVFLSILSQALSFILISKAARTLDPRLLTGYMLIFGSILLFFIGQWQEPHGLKGIFHAPILLWAAFLSSAVLSTALGHMVYNSAIKKIGPAEASIFINLSTFFSLVGSAVLLGEIITSIHLFGLLFIVAGVVLGSGAFEDLLRKRKRKELGQTQKNY
ncbi:DMT family transporter [Bacillus sp. S/N-304-OC-R1]|uniref:DMT family transporter n=1 Tax=Bacillus sp. S/N-304-OC-R1 TaxID=2758034 RepID=UPI001C8DC6E6|nr:DMT family transporter [Bacillus sp. S/N-304-OC-R1]MBY0122070.1 DMT family transporter [Bacillus sp. S/N-304-OC-R1]